VDSSLTVSYWMLSVGAVGIVLGLIVWGKRVIETIGAHLTEITPSSGFAIVMGASSTILLASIFALPVSTTQCIVGSVVFVGYASNQGVVSWKTLVLVVLSWIITIPASGMFIFHVNPKL